MVSSTLRGITAGEHDGNWNPVGYGGADHEAVALFETFEGEREAAQLVLVVGVGAGHVDQQIGVEHGQRRAIPFSRRWMYSASPTPSARWMSRLEGGFSLG